MKNVYILLISTLLSLSLTTKVNSQESSLAKFQLRRSVTDQNKIQKPAQVQLTFPSEGDAIYTFDAAINILPFGFRTGSIDWGTAFTLEWHRNNAIEQEQNALLVSASALGIINSDKFSIYPQASLKFQRDEVQEDSSILGTLDFTALVPKVIGAYFGSKELQFLWQPKIGLEYESIVDADESNSTGDVLRGLAAMDFAIYPFGKSLKRRLILLTELSYRFDIAESEDIDDGDDNRLLQRYSLTYYFSDKQNYAMGVDYVNGSDPIIGLSDQEFTQLALKFKF